VELGAATVAGQEAIFNDEGCQQKEPATGLGLGRNCVTFRIEGVFEVAYTYGWRHGEVTRLEVSQVRFTSPHEGLIRPPLRNPERLKREMHKLGDYLELARKGQADVVKQEQTQGLSGKHKLRISYDPRKAPHRAAEMPSRLAPVSGKQIRGSLENENRLGA
jgi:hypothetical protein